MRIQSGEVLKAALQRGVALFHATFRSSREIQVDLEHAADPVTRRLFAIVTDVAGKVKSPYHRQAFVDVACFLLWVGMKDTAYRDQRDEALRLLLSDVGAVLPHVPAKPPEEWVVNLWWEREESGKADERRWGSG